MRSSAFGLATHSALRATGVLQRYLTSSTDWIVLNVTMDVLTQWAGSDPGLRIWLVPQLERLSRDSRKSVATRAGKRLAEIRRELNESGA